MSKRNMKNNTKSLLNNYINHIVFVVDQSGSMRGISDTTIRVFDNQIKHLAKRSSELNQETRVSVYLFDDKVTCAVYDKDVLRLPSLKDYYHADGSTALIDATITALNELQETPQRHGDHSFLIYVLTDGGENRSNNLSDTLRLKIGSLAENWTLACLVPDQTGVSEAKRFGFPANNISVWSTTERGMDDVGDLITQTTNTYFTNRSAGIRGTKNLFSLDTSNLTKNVVKSVLNEVSPKNYLLLMVHRDSVIKEYIESWTNKPYVPGSTYYQLSKKEAVQSYKGILVQDKSNGKVYSGDSARNLIGLPDYEVKIAADNYSNYNIFIQSMSTNRKLIKGTQVIVLI